MQKLLTTSRYSGTTRKREHTVEATQPRWILKEVEMEFPTCQKCKTGVLIPLSDYGQEGASVLFKAWVCINPECGFSLRVDKGEVSYGKKIEPKH